jgi:hypothetical protein
MVYRAKTLGPITKKDRMRFESKIDKLSSSQRCWHWTGGLNINGYGKIWIKGATYQAHRVSYELYKGFIDKDLLVCHSCDNPICINPEHLWLGTCKENIRDSFNKKRKIMPKGENCSWSKLTKEQVNEIKSKYVPYKYHSSMLAKEYKVSGGAILKIINNENWRQNGIQIDKSTK